MSSDTLLSHEITPASIEKNMQQIRQNIEDKGDKPYITVAKQIEILEQLAAFDFGRFLIQNKGINGYWTHYMLTHPWFGRKTQKNNRGEAFSEMERFLLDALPLMLATQERFQIFLKENQKSVTEGAVLACIPSGLMGELLYLDYSQIKHIKLVGIDLDEHSIDGARALSEKKHLSQFTNFYQKDAWQLTEKNTFDLISSNGLNIYEQDETRILSLYQAFYSALKPGGKLVTSILTPPPGHLLPCDWDMSQISEENLLLQKIIFSDILPSKFQNFMTRAQIKSQFESIGFQSITFIDDKARLFPTVTAVK